MTDARGSVHSFGFDALGRLSKDQEPTPSPPTAASQTSLLSGWPARDPPIGRANACVHRMMTATVRGAMLAPPSLWELTKMAVVATARIDSGCASWPELVLPAISL